MSPRLPTLVGVLLLLLLVGAGGSHGANAAVPARSAAAGGARTTAAGSSGSGRRLLAGTPGAAAAAGGAGPTANVTATYRGDWVKLAWPVHLSSGPLRQTGGVAVLKLRTMGKTVVSSQ